MKRTKNHLFIALFVMICILSVFGISSYAAEPTKTVKVTLPQDYVQCTFYISFENGINRTTSLISPSGDVYSFEEDEEKNILSCTVKNAKHGDWKVVATTAVYTGESDGEIENTESSEDSNTETVEDIGKMTINVKSETETKKSVSDNIKIAKEITGLKIYWKDDNLEIEWQDETVGNVDIVIANSKTLQVLGKATVKDKRYELPIEQTIDEIIVSIVPSVSAGVKGAEKQYVIQVDNHPDASVTFENVEFTNKDFIKASVEMNNSYSLLYTVNDIEVGNTELLTIGTHEIEVPTVDGNNDMKVYVVDDNGNMRSTQLQFVKDIVPPVLKITNDISGVKTYESSVIIKGTVEDYDVLQFRNDNIVPEWDGTFEVTATLKEGSNAIELKALDKAGNEAIYTANVTMLVKEPVEIPWNIIIVTILVIALILLFIIQRKRRGVIKIENDSVKKKAVKLNASQKETKADYVCFAITLLVVIIICQGVIQRAKAMSNSMEPTIETNESIIVDKLAYVLKEPQRGDVVIFESNEIGNKMLLKRIIGMPGDKISFVDGYVLINGVVADESAYLDESIETNCTKDFEIPSDCYFVLGDNRSKSYDSRYWDEPYIKKSDIKGKMLFKTNIMAVLKNYI